jgi:two-component system, OmpR family, catabolic regulation response regulator CreB
MHSGPRVIICEDEPAIVDSLVHVLRSENMQCSVASLGAIAVELSRSHNFDLMLLDIGLPDMSGFEVCRQIRHCSNLPIVFLTARNDEIDRIVGLELGADDYIAKPFSPREVVARVKAILRRTKSVSVTPMIVEDGLFVVDDERKLVCFCNQPLDLTRNEFMLLRFLLSSPQRVFERGQIMKDVWRDGTSVLDRSVDAHIKAIRQKLREIAPQLDPIRTHRGLGYSVSTQRENLP